MVEVTTTFSDETFALMESFAKEQEVNLSDVMRQKMLDWLEDQEDLRDAEAAYEEYLKNPVSYSLDEVKAELGLA